MAEKIRLSLLTVTLSAVLCGCAGPVTPMTGASPEAPTPNASGMPIMLYTHCGIEELRVDDTFFIAETPLNDGQGNPPPGWGNPYQAGTVTVSGPLAVFRDDSGHVVTFRARPGATGLPKICS
ncbi:hypothetical protein [Arthrobacter bambusae]|uniref:hypothetical protein n=1 Tax=Arthrobacter bambusae TaxID=1338426 RepID=UPI002788BE6E|nr:hypothetical protein [Arthrobacter bambusae]MDQ0028774.1 hypothetical protein [Arthrobacter bambusae]MDQ0096432.1 hypothetical protein [Arthrobacter bambusae]